MVGTLRRQRRRRAGNPLPCPTGHQWHSADRRGDGGADSGERDTVTEPQRGLVPLHRAGADGRHPWLGVVHRGDALDRNCPPRLRRRCRPTRPTGTPAAPDRLPPIRPERTDRVVDDVHTVFDGLIDGQNDVRRWRRPRPLALLPPRAPCTRRSKRWARHRRSAPSRGRRRRPEHWDCRPPCWRYGCRDRPRPAGRHSRPRGSTAHWPGTRHRSTGR